MGATFDVDLMYRIGSLLGDEARYKNIQVLLAPTVCLQRSPLIGRGFEAFAEDPVLSGLMASAYIRGIQDRGIAACIKHFAAHDQSLMSIEDNVRMSERTLRELHLLPFQLAYRYSNPWSIMTSYNKINNIHSSEDPLLLKQILRQEWGFKGLVMSDWWGTYSTVESLDAGMDLEMPGPTQFRGNLLAIAVKTRKVSRRAVDEAARNVLNFIKKVTAVAEPWVGDPSAANTAENRALVRRLAADSIVLLKNDNGDLPIKDAARRSYGLIGDHFKYPALSGGGSAEGDPYYAVTPYDALVEIVGEANVTYTPGLYTFKFVPFLKNLDQPGTSTHGWRVDIFGENPDDSPDAGTVYSTATDKDLIDVPESLHKFLPHKYFVRARATFTPEVSARFRFGFAVAGKGRVKLDDRDAIDLWKDQPPKTEDTPCFNRLSMERFYDLDVQKGRPIAVEVLMVNEDVSGGVGTAFTLAGRLGGFETLEPQRGLEDAVRIAKSVDIPIVMAGLSSDYESEASDRKNLELPAAVNQLVHAVLDANPNATVDRDPLFYFGYGLSYTEFEYSQLVVPHVFEASAEHETALSVDVKNTGPYDGAEVIQVHISDVESSIQRPMRELKAFAKVQLTVGETKTVSLKLNKYALSFWSEEDGQWRAERGSFDVIIATSSHPDHEVLRARFQLPETFLWSGW
ncbi:putative beta-glucosidase K [Fusarium oxysporum f. sp. cubense]|uniref:beta-glucosidase n=1 Tax=Fusarium oxysporum f. sp. cubense TaxID=61366 RepID=A0A559KSG1_FUSOC|nr:putative beta-glucosidase K [Fusarium oxysporum f. sp. cubense]